MSKENDYYDTLGVSKDASESDIKKAFRSLSLKYHPDRNIGEDTTTKFQKINQAYETLSDKEKRKQYDNEQNGVPFGHFGMPGGPFTHMNSMDEFSDINNIFNMMFSGGMGGPGGMGGMPGIRIFHSGGGHPGPQMFQQFHKPSPVVKNISITLNQAYDGGDIQVEYERFVVNNNIKYTEVQTICVSLHKGAHDGETILIEGEGNCINDVVKGDVKLTVRIQDHPLFKRSNNDLIYKKKITLKEALCGFEFDIEHLNGKKLHLNNKSNRTIITPDTKKTIPNFGMDCEGKMGNLIIEFQIDFPINLTEEQINVIGDIL